MLTEKEIERVQKQWADGIVYIGTLANSPIEYRAATEDFLNRYYAYHHTQVLFKPTRATFRPFRLTREGALSYFIGGNPDYPEDMGFALEPWVHVVYDNACMRIYDNNATAMGHYTFINANDQKIWVEYTIGYMLGPDDHLLIFQHHSSLPFPAN